MKKAILPLLLAGAALIVSCGSNDSKVAQKTTEIATEVQSQVQQEESPATTANKERQATADLCNCVNNFLADMSPRVRQIIVDASKSNNPVQVLTSELQKVKSEEEQQRLAREFQKFESDQQLQKCSEDIKRKYNLDENNAESREKVLQAAKENKDCELVYALMKIGMQQDPAIRK